MFGKIQKSLMACSAAISALLFVSAPASAADVYIPDGFTVETLTVGDVHARPGDGLTEVFATAWDGKVFDLVFRGCDITWLTNDAFYFIHVRDVGLFMTPVKTFDILLARNNMNFAIAAQKAIDAKVMCDGPRIWKYSG